MCFQCETKFQCDFQCHSDYTPIRRAIDRPYTKKNNKTKQNKTKQNKTKQTSNCLTGPVSAKLLYEYIFISNY